MKNPFKKVNAITNPIDDSLKFIKKSAIKSGVNCAVNAAAAIATPVVIKFVNDNIDDKFAKKVIYGTSGVLCAYQVVETIRQFGKARALISAYKTMKGYEDEVIENEAKALLNELSTEMEGK